MTESCCAGPAPPSPFRIYRPLLVSLALSGAVAIVLATLGLHSGAMRLMADVMGTFMLCLGLLQLRHLRAFAALFSAYDPLAARIRLYGIAYPFLGIILGLAYLAESLPLLVNGVTLIIMAVSACGVVRVMRSGRTLQCACAGSAYVLPVGRVTLAEYTAMALMAAINLLMLV